MSDKELIQAIHELEAQCTPVETPNKFTWKDGTGKGHYVHKKCIGDKSELECCECNKNHISD